MKPEHPAARSKAAAPVAPRLFWTMQAVAGIGMSGVTVAQMIRSTCEAGRAAAWSAASAARVANCDMYSSSCAMRRSRIPVREMIHSSEVSTILSRSAFVSTRAGREEPVPRIIARLSPRVIETPQLDIAAGVDPVADAAARRHSEDFVVDAIVHPVPHEILGHAHGVLDGPHGRPAVADDRRGPHAEKGHPPVFGVVDLLAEVAKRRARQEVTHLGQGRLGDLLLHEVQDGLRGAFDGLERDIADEPVADDHVRLAVEDIPPLDVADEVERGLLEGAERFPRDFVSLAVLLADAHQTDPGR